MRLDTPTNMWTLVAATNLDLGSSVTTARSPTSTMPAGIANESVILPPAENYYKVVVFNDDSGAATSLRVVGWSKFMQGSVTWWMPTLLARVSATGDTASIAMGGSATMFPAISYTVNQGSANCKVVDGTGYACPATLMVDTLGAELVELCFTSASIDANALVQPM